MKLLIDLDRYDGGEYITVESPLFSLQGIPLRMVVETFKVVAMGDSFFAPSAEHRTLEQLMLSIKPSDPGEMPKEENKHKLFEELLSFREVMKGASYIPKCFCENEDEHFAHLVRWH